VCPSFSLLTSLNLQDSRSNLPSAHLARAAASGNHGKKRIGGGRLQLFEACHWSVEDRREEKSKGVCRTLPSFQDFRTNYFEYIFIWNGLIFRLGQRQRRGEIDFIRFETAKLASRLATFLSQVTVHQRSVFSMGSSIMAKMFTPLTFPNYLIVSRRWCTFNVTYQSSEFLDVSSRSFLSGSVKDVSAASI